MPDFTNSEIAPREVCGWCYSQSGEPVAYIMTEGEPDSSMLVPQPNWWTAIRFAVMFAHNNDNVRYIGGPCEAGGAA